MNIHIIILNWNGKEDTLECLESVKSINYLNYNIIVADNGSSDDSVHSIRQQYPDIFVLENNENLGYAEGNNRAVKFAIDHDADAVVLLNNDTIVDPDLLNSFDRAYYNLPNVGVLGAISFYYDNPEMIWAAGGIWNFSSHHQKHVCKNHKIVDLPSQNPFEVEYVIGCALFIHKKTISDIGLMDSKYFLNCEEDDWCRRAKYAGYRIYTVPEAKIWHKVASSFGGNSPLWKYFMTRNQLYWAKQHLPCYEYRNVVKRTIREILPLLSLSDKNGKPSLKTIYWGINTWINQLYERWKDPYYKAQIHGLFHYYINKFGDCPSKLKSVLTASK